MRKLLCRAVFALYASHALGADPRWIRMPSEDFEIFSTAGEGDTRRTLQNFERVRLFFDQVLGGKVDKTDPVRIIVFGSKKEYAPYRPNEFAVAYYTQLGGRDYIVMGDTGDEVFPVAVHEYVHLVVQHSGFAFPPWFNEGLAELYSTIKPAADKVLMGTPIAARVQALQRDKWVPLATIVSADRNSPYYNEKDKAGSLYNEGWLLTHMLALNSQYAANFPKFTAALQKAEAVGTESASQTALESTFGKPLSQIDKDLQTYSRTGSFTARIFNTKLQSGVRVDAAPANLFDVRLALADLLSRPGKEAESRRTLQALVNEDPKRPEPHVALGYLAWRDHQNEEARASFQKAVELGSQNTQMLWDYGRMAMGSNPESAMKAFNTLLTAQPNRLEVRLALAQTQMNVHQAKDAIETLKPMRTVTPKDAEVFFKMLAFANLQTEDHDEAKANAQKWLEYAKDPGERDSAEKMLDYLDNRARAAAQVRAAPQQRERPAEPALARSTVPPSLTSAAIPNTPAPNTPMRMLPQRPFIAGTMVELDCKNTPPNLVVLQPGKGRVSFLMDEPRSIVLSGLKDAIIDMNCGPQKPAAVWVEYAEPAPTQKGIAGLVRAIHFEPLPGAAGEKSQETDKLKTR